MDIPTLCYCFYFAYVGPGQEQRCHQSSGPGGCEAPLGGGRAPVPSAPVPQGHPAHCPPPSLVFQLLLSSPFFLLQRCPDSGQEQPSNPLLGAHSILHLGPPMLLGFQVQSRPGSPGPWVLLAPEARPGKTWA